MPNQNIDTARFAEREPGYDAAPAAVVKTVGATSLRGEYSNEVPAPVVKDLATYYGAVPPQNPLSLGEGSVPGPSILGALSKKSTKPYILGIN